jgi:hypothetical protein
MVEITAAVVYIHCFDLYSRRHGEKQITTIVIIF